MSESSGGVQPVQGLTRRQFIRGAAAAAGLVLARGVIAQTDLVKTGIDMLVASSKEALKPVANNVLIVDFAPEQQNEAFVQTSFVNNDELIKDLLGNDYMSDMDILRNYGLDIAGAGTDKYEMFSVLFQKNPKVAIALALKSQFKEHGSKVGESMQKTWEKLGYRSKPSIHPIQEMMGDFSFQKDDLGNLGFLGEISAEKVISKLQAYPNQDIVNFSWQFGKVGFFYLEKIKNLYQVSEGKIVRLVPHEVDGKKYFSVEMGNPKPAVVEGDKVYLRQNDGSLKLAPQSVDDAIASAMEEISSVAKVESLSKPQIQIIDGYRKETAENHLMPLLEVCKAFPNKLFIVAAGNVDDDLRIAREKLKGEWPQNLLLVAEWSTHAASTFNENIILDSQVYGADIYVDNKEMQIATGSSFSTSILTAIASIIREYKHLPAGEIKKQVLSLTDQKTYVALRPANLGFEYDQPAHVLNLQKVIQFLQS